MSKTSPAPQRVTSRTTAPNGRASSRSLRGVTAEPSVERVSPLATGALGFAGLFWLVAPHFLGQFWPATNDFWPQTLWLGALAVLFLLLFAARLGVGKLSLGAGLLLAFGAWCALSVPGAAYRHDALLEGARVLGVVALFFGFRGVLRLPDAAFWLCAAIVAESAWVALNALWSYSIEPTRAFGTFFNPNLFATWNAMTLPLALALTLVCVQRTRERELWKWAALASGLAALLIAGALVVTGSKGGFLAAFVALLAFAIVILRAQTQTVKNVLRTNARILLPVALLLTLAGGAIGMRTVVPRLLATRGADDNSTMFRVYTWRATLDMAQARPVLGWGAGAFPSVYDRFAQTGETRSAHQSWLQLASECGFLAPLLLLGAWGATSWRSLSRIRKSRNWALKAGAFGAATALVAHGFTDDGWKIIATASLFIFSLALLDTSEENDEPSPPQRDTSRLLHFAFFIFSFSFLIFSFRAAQAASTWNEAEAMLARATPTFALQRADASVQTMPLSARAHVVRAWCLTGSGNTQGARQALERARELQPTLAAHPFNLARLLTRDAPQETQAIAQNLDRAVALAPNDLDILLARGEWKLSRNNASGWRDFERVSQLADAPYGRYPAQGDDVNLDFSRAWLQLAERAKRRDAKAASRLLSRVRSDLQRAKTERALFLYQVQEASGVLGAVDARKAEIANLEAEANSLGAP